MACKLCMEKDCVTGNFIKLSDPYQDVCVYHYLADFDEDESKASNSSEHIPESLIIIHNPNKRHIDRDVLMNKINANRVDCPFCKTFLQRTNELLKVIDLETAKTIHGLCEHCKNIPNVKCFKCKRCAKAKRVFKSAHLGIEDGKEENITRWLHRVKGMLENLLVKHKLEKQQKLKATRSYSDPNLYLHETCKGGMRSLVIDDFRDVLEREKTIPESNATDAVKKVIKDVKTKAKDDSQLSMVFFDEGKNVKSDSDIMYKAQKLTHLPKFGNDEKTFQEHIDKSDRETKRKEITSSAERLDTDIGEKGMKHEKIQKKEDKGKRRGEEGHDFLPSKSKDSRDKTQEYQQKDKADILKNKIKKTGEKEYDAQVKKEKGDGDIQSRKRKESGSKDIQRDKADLTEKTTQETKRKKKKRDDKETKDKTDRQKFTKQEKGKERVEKESKSKQSKIKEVKQKEAKEIKDKGVKEKGTKKGKDLIEKETKDKELKEKELKTKETKEKESKDKGVKEESAKKGKENEIKDVKGDKEVKEKGTKKEKEEKVKEIKGKESKEKEIKAKNTKEKEHKDEDDKKKGSKQTDGKDQDVKNKGIKKKGSEKEGKDTESKDGKEKKTKEKEIKAKDTEEKGHIDEEDKEKGAKKTDGKDQSKKDSGTSKSKEIKDKDIDDKDKKSEEKQEKEVNQQDRDRELKEKESNNKEKSVEDKESKEKGMKEKGAKDKGIKTEDSKDKRVNEKYSKDKSMKGTENNEEPVFSKDDAEKSKRDKQLMDDLSERKKLKGVKTSEDGTNKKDSKGKQSKSDLAGQERMKKVRSRHSTQTLGKKKVEDKIVHSEEPKKKNDFGLIKEGKNKGQSQELKDTAHTIPNFDYQKILPRDSLAKIPIPIETKTMTAGMQMLHAQAEELKNRLKEFGDMSFHTRSHRVSGDDHGFKGIHFSDVPTAGVVNVPQAEIVEKIEIPSPPSPPINMSSSYKDIAISSEPDIKQKGSEKEKIIRGLKIGKRSKVKFFKHGKDTPLILQDKVLTRQVIASVNDFLEFEGESQEFKNKLRRKGTPSSMQSKVGGIKYALSDPQYIKNGWTKLPEERIVRKLDVYEMNSTGEPNWFMRNREKGRLFYNNGKLLAEVTEDGAGTIYYCSGDVALEYYPAQEPNAKFRYTVYSNHKENHLPTCILASFDLIGNGIVYDHSGNVRLRYNQSEGYEADSNGNMKAHWKWHTLNDPPKPETVIIDSLMPVKDPDIQAYEINNPGIIIDEDIVDLEKQNAVEGLRSNNHKEYLALNIKMKALKINDQFSLKIHGQSNIQLLFQDRDAFVKFKLGLTINSRKVLAHEIENLGSVTSSYDRQPAPCESLAKIQKIVLSTRERSERERKKLQRITRPPKVFEESKVL